MIVTFKAYETVEENPFKFNDRVVVIYKDSKYFMKTGTVNNIKTSGSDKGDCSILMDYDNTYVNFYYTNIEKILDLIGMPSGEVLYATLKDAQRLSGEGLIRYSSKGNFYFFDDEDKWEVESDTI